MWVRYLGQEDTLEDEMATHCSILAWRIAWTEEPGSLWSLGSQSKEQGISCLQGNKQLVAEKDKYRSN